MGSPMAAEPEGAGIRTATFTNPILPGSYPDPSIVRVGDDFYLVNSSFEYFPGLPIHHSRDLVNWELAGYALQDPDYARDAVNLVDVQSNGGLHAPSIRYHDGVFHVITTNVHAPADGSPAKMVNFVVTAERVQGPWSKPVVIENAPGIDPDIFFDDDGRAWYLGTQVPEKPNFPGEGEIWMQELNSDNWQLTGERHFLWRGACGGTWAEGPHIYKRDGRYYLLVAEGGTHFNHAAMIAVSDDIRGPYISNARNPIMTARHLSYDNWVNSTGHADLVELADGRWFMVALGIRGDEQRRSNMGRETFLAPVIWEREPFEWKEVKHEWPVVAPQTGRIERRLPLPLKDTRQRRKLAFVDEFDASQLDLQWNFRRVPRAGTYSLSQRPGFLRLHAKPDVIQERGRASLMGTRQTESDFSYRLSMRFEPKASSAEAGMVLVQKDDNYLTFTLSREARGHFLKLMLAEPGTAPRELRRASVDGYGGNIHLHLESKGGRYRFGHSLDGGATSVAFVETSATHALSHGYTGAYLGVYATGNGQETGSYADFDWVRYRAFERN
ncbi:MAG: glycoside hydrolase family 43 protein [Gammaproteobacteria bacterium]|nr:glycoside hydrolase family 43 protein [Gammaproteobacteria bacterium]MYG12271.1 glycoside hydrolase family 43 protein [Gammaproteobacteria bacterium]MYK28500.1 glycoside hydrolase family 43 protein [Gammaproteobacteria bacterium]